MFKAIYCFFVALLFAVFAGCSVISPRSDDGFFDKAYIATETAKEVVDEVNEVSPSPLFYGVSATLGGLLALLGFASGKVSKKKVSDCLKRAAISATVAVAQREREDDAKNNSVNSENDSKDAKNGNAQ